MPIDTDYHAFWYRTNYSVVTPQDDWRISEDQDMKVGVRIKDLIRFCKDTTEIELDQIAYVGMHMPYNEFYQQSEYRDVDISYPGIVVPGIRNPPNLPYLLIDGRHRITKMKILGMTSSKFYVISKDQLYQYTSI